jgi:glycosyltransferase involved in cell wall biosynthesis
VILDIHDIVPEFYVSKFGKPQGGGAFKLLQMMERVSAKMANHVILANHLWLEKYTKRSAAPEKCTVFINNVDTRVFYPRPRSHNDGKLILLFPGGLQWHQGLDIAIRAFKQVSPLVQNAEFHIYGEGNVKPDLVSLVQQLGLQGKVRFFEPMGIRRIADVMANADLGVVPKRADSFGNEAYSTKIMEFMSLGVPMVVSSTKIDRYYFNDSVVRFFESGNVEALANALLELFRNHELRNGLSERARNYAKANSWDIRKSDYLELVDSLVENRSRVIAGSGTPAANIDTPAIPQSETAVAP